MLAKKHRLTGSKNFDRVQKEGKMHQSDSFGLAYVDRKDEDPSRFAFVVSTKIAKDAVDRNRLRRNMSESVRTTYIDIKKGLDVVFLAKTSILRVPTSDLMKEVRKALKDSEISK